MRQVDQHIVEIKSVQFSVNSQSNPKEHCYNVVTKKEDETEEKREETEREKKKSEEEKIKNKERGVFAKDLSYLHPPSKKEKERKFFDKLLPKNYFAKNLKKDLERIGATLKKEI